jgi:hypothetical protein
MESENVVILPTGCNTVNLTAEVMSGGKFKWSDQSPGQDIFFWSAIG